MAPGISRQSIQFQGDLSYRDQSFTLQTVQRYTRLDRRPHSTHTIRSDLVLRSGVLAVRQNGKAWRCGKEANLSEGLGGLLPLPDLGAGTTVTFAPHPMQFLGATAVWAVRVTVRRPTLGGSTKARLFIASTDDTIVQETETTKLSIRIRHGRSLQAVTSTASSSATYTQYGEPVTVSLPPACASGVQPPSA